MASNYTSNYGLCQWQASDKVLRTEFNADNAKIDAALNSMASSISGKASASALNSLKTTVNGKASQSALDSLTSVVNGLKSSKADKTALEALSRTVSGHTSTLSNKGNCQLCAIVYTGDGSKTKTLTFPGPPSLTFFFGLSGGGMVAVARGMNVVHWYQGSSSCALEAACSGNSVTLSSLVAESSMNGIDRNYIAVGFVPADA